ncbi:MAG: Outer rane autotransporter barrel [Myxococcaceae bacterium]|nr:Outer rane autotransporter barrel [Myxococcaceae bacterium]
MKDTRKTTAVALLGALLFGSVAAQDKAPEKAVTVAEPVAEVSERPSERAAGKSSELAQIERELAVVMDELVAARVRAGVLARSLFHTELTVDVSRRAGDQTMRRMVLRLDGVPVHDSDGSTLARSNTQLFTGYVTPGRHELAIELTEAGKDDATYGYTRSERYRIDVKKDRRTRVELVLKDDSDMAEEAAEGDEGEYQVETIVRVTSERAPD